MRLQHCLRLVSVLLGQHDHGHARSLGGISELGLDPTDSVNASIHADDSGQAHTRLHAHPREHAHEAARGRQPHLPTHIQTRHRSVTVEPASHTQARLLTP